MFLLLATACGGDVSEDTVQQGADEPELVVNTSAPTVTTEETPATTEEPGPECGDDAIEIGVGQPVDGAVEMGETFSEDVFYCVEVPPGSPSVTFELTGLSENLDLYVGYPDMETVQNGGFTFWFSDNDGTADEVAIAMPGLEDHVNPGSYYIEVSSPDGRGVSDFTLTVTTP